MCFGTSPVFSMPLDTVKPIMLRIGSMVVNPSVASGKVSDGVFRP